MGTRQTGAMHFKIADLSRDSDLLDNIQQIADTFFNESPEAVQPLIDRWLGDATDYAEV
jgi:ATP-dependent DNA helicase RecG